MQLTSDQVNVLCEEVETQWLHHMMVRAAFPNKFFNAASYPSRSFYAKHGVQLQMRWTNRNTSQFRAGALGLTEWLNQNWIIRLYGILDSHKLISHGKSNDVIVVHLVDFLRNNIGAHSTGRGQVPKHKLRKATRLLSELLGRTEDSSSLASYNLAVDSVLLPMKEAVLEYIKGFGTQS